MSGMLFASILIVSTALFSFYVNGAQISLSKAEQAWLQQHPVIRVARDPDYAPFEYRNNQWQIQGLSPDILEYCLTTTGLKIKEINTTSWQQALNHLKAAKADLVTVATKTAEREKYLSFSQPYISFPVVILTRNDINKELTLDDLYGQTLLTVKGFGVNEYLTQFKDKIHIINANSIAEGLQRVSFGSADAMVLNLATASYQIQKMKLTNLRVSGTIDFTYQLSFAVRSEFKPLIPILNKALAAMPAEKKLQITNKWITIDQYYWRPSKYQMLMLVAIFAGLGFTLMSLLNRSLNQKLKRRNVELEHKSSLLESEIEERKQLEIKLKKQVYLDDLTGLANRRKLLERVMLEWPRSLRGSSPISLLMLDIDLFKQVNDTFGHDIGDQVLVIIANILQDSTRVTDLVARWGGEEFVLLLPETGHDLAMEIAERIRKNIAEKTLIFEQQKVSFTVSIGVATTLEGEPSFNELLIIADMALYQSKEQGRNRVSSIII